MSEDNEKKHQAALQREHEEHWAAVSDVSGKIAALEEEERRKRAEKEEKERDLAGLRNQLERCQGWISFIQKKITETKQVCVRQIAGACSGQGDVILLLKENVQHLAA